MFRSRRVAADRLTPGAPPPSAPRVADLRPPAQLADDRRWLGLLVMSRLGATAVAVGLLGFSGAGVLDVLAVAYGVCGAALLARSRRLRHAPAAWAADSLLVLGAILQSGDWRSPFYLLWLTTLALPATALPRRYAPWLAVGSALGFLLVAVAGGPAPGQLQLVSTETLAIHLALPVGLVLALAHAADVVRRLGVERLERERLAIEAERRRIAWELHDSAKQRLHAAHLLVSSLVGVDLGPRTATVGRAVIELESAASDMDASLAELRSPLEGRPLHTAIDARAGELSADGGPAISVHGTAPPLPPLIGAHLYRIACEALTNALRHADARTIEIRICTRASAMSLRIADDGRGLGAEERRRGSGLLSMESRAATIGADLRIDSRGPDGGTVIDIDLPLGQEAS
jgi:signal transduction histidine kinase